MFQVLDVCTNVFPGGGIPSKIAYLIHVAILAIQIVVPLLLIIWGMLDLGKAVIEQKEENIKKGQQTLIKRVIAAVLVFFVISIATLVVKFVAEDSETIIGCLDSIISCDGYSCVDK